MDNETLESTLRERLRNSEQQLDAATRQRLQQIRRRALQQPPAAAHSRHWQGWLLAATVAAVAIYIGVPDPAVSVGDTEAMAVEVGPQDDLDLYENLEFYEWLAAQEDLG